MKSVAGRLRLDLAQFRELEAFAEFGSDLDKASQAQLDRGSRIVEILKQAQYAPFSMEEQVVSIWAVTNGYMDDIPLDKCRDFESGLLDHVRSRHSGVLEKIRDTGKLEDDTLETMKKAVEEFKSSFTDRVETVETVAAQEGVPEPSDTGEDEAPTDTATPDDKTDTSKSGDSAASGE